MACRSERCVLEAAPIAIPSAAACTTRPIVAVNPLLEDCCCFAVPILLCVRLSATK